MDSGFKWGVTDLNSPWTDLDGPGLASAVGALQLLPENQGSALKLHVLASIAVGLPERAKGATVSASNLRTLLKQTALQDPEGTGEFEITDLFCSEANLQGRPFRFIAGSGTSASMKMEFLAQAILTVAGKDLPVGFLEPAADLIFAVAHLSEAVCARAGVARTRPPVATDRGRASVPGAARLRALERAVQFPLSQLGDEVLTTLLPLASRPGKQSDVYPSHVSEVVAIKPLLVTGSDLIVLCPGELAGALAVQLQTMAVEMGCTAELASAHEKYVTAYVHDLVMASPIAFTSPASHPNLGVSVISGDLQGQAIHIVVAVDPLEDFEPDEPFGMWITADPGSRVSALALADPEAPPVVIYCMASTTRGQAMFTSGADGVHWLALEAADLVTLFRLKWNDRPWELVRFARAAKKLEASTRIFAESLLGVYGVYDDHHDSFYLSDEALPSMLMIDGQHTLKYRIAERVKLDEHLVPMQSGSIRSVSLSGTDYAPIYFLFERVPALSIEIEGLFVWIRARTVGNDAPVGELLEGVAYWMWQLVEALGQRIHARELRVLLTVDTGNFGDPFEVEQVSENQFHLRVRLAVALAEPPSLNEFDRALVAVMVSEIIQPVIGEELELARIVDEIAPLGDKRMFLVGTNPIPELHDLRIAALGRTVPDSLISEVLDELGEQLFETDSYPVGDIDAGRTTEVLNEAVAVLYHRLTELVGRYDVSVLLKRLIGHAAGLEVSTRVERMRRSTRIACYGSEHYPPEKLRLEANKRAEASLGVRFLVEFVSAIGSGGSAIPNDDQYDRLCALAVELVSKGMHSDASFFELSDVRVSRLESGRLGLSRDDRWATGLVEHSEVLIARQLRGEPDRDEDVSDWKFTVKEDRAFTAEFGFTVHEMQIGLIALYEDIAHEEDSPAVVTAVRDEAIAAIVARTGWRDERAATLLDLFSLKPLLEFTLGPETRPWRYGRSRSYLRQPVVVGPGALLLWSPTRLLSSVGDLVTLYRTGRLKGRSSEMTAVLGSVRQASNDQFERRVAARYRDLGYSSVHERVTSWANKQLRASDGSNLGDIDVLVVDEAQQRIIVVEAKDFETARTPVEMNREMKKLRNEAVPKSHRRADWIREHLHLFALSTTGWVVEEVVVTSRRSTAVATKNGHETVLAFDDLEGPRAV